jgi:heme/copper-type cytochrome/quinol oxidase subunit 3
MRYLVLNASSLGRAMQAIGAHSHFVDMVCLAVFCIVYPGVRP